MTSVEVLTHIIADLKKVRFVCDEDKVSDVPDIASRYLSENHEAIECLANCVYSKLDHEGRLALLKQHRELDYSVLDDHFLEIGLDAVRNAKSRSASKFARKLVTILDDDLNMLLRILEFAKYVPCDECSHELVLSPIENHGLDRKAGNFVQITEDDSRKVPWHLSDIVYNDRKKEGFEQSKEIGFNLERPGDSIMRTEYARQMEECGRLIAELVKYRIECDLAAIALDPKLNRARYLNVCVTRAHEAFGDLIVALRQGIFRFGPETPTFDFIKVVERDLDPLRENCERLFAGIPRTHPRATIFQAIAELSAATKPPQEHIMGNKYVVNSPAAAVGDNATAHDITFNQVWNQYGGGLDLEMLTRELGQLRANIRQMPPGHDQDVALGAIATAQVEAKKGNGPQVLEHLSKAGKWVIGAATTIGTTVAAEALKKSMGL